MLKILILIVCWPENGRPLLAPPRNDVWLTREDQQRMTNEVSLLRVLLIGWNKFHFWNYEYMKMIYVNCGVKNYFKEDQRSCIRNLCSCEKKPWKTIQSCTGFEPLTSAMPVGSALPIKLTSQLGVGRWSWFVINPWKDNDEIMNIWKSYMWTAEWRIIWRKVIAVVYATYACSCEKKAWKKIQAVNVDHAQELTGMGKRSTDIAFFCVFWINTIK